MIKKTRRKRNICTNLSSFIQIIKRLGSWFREIRIYNFIFVFAIFYFSYSTYLLLSDLNTPYSTYHLDLKKGKAINNYILDTFKLSSFNKGDSVFIGLNDSNRIFVYPTLAETLPNERQQINNNVTIKDSFLLNPAITSIDFKKNTLFKKCYFKQIDSNELLTSTIRALHFSGDVLFDSCQFSGYNIWYNCYFDKTCTLNESRYSDSGCINIFTCKFKTLEFKQLNNSLGNIYLDDVQIERKLSFKGCTFGNNKTVSFWALTPPDTVDLSYCNPGGVINLDLYANQFNPALEKMDFLDNPILKFIYRPLMPVPLRIKPIKLNLTGFDLNKINFEYEAFELYFDENISDEQENSIYIKLLEKFKREGKVSSYEKLDIEYHNKVGGISNKINKVWWLYGYRKSQVFLWAIMLILFFSMFNSYKFYSLLNVYQIGDLKRRLVIHSRAKKFRNEKPNQSFFYYSYLVLLYTVIIFFGIKLDFSRMDTKRPFLVIIIILEYIVGLICSGFILNIIISK